MFFHKMLRSISPFFLLLLVGVLSTNAQAKRNNASTGSNCLNKKQLNQIAKTSLIELQSLDSSLTLTDVKLAMKSAGSCASMDDINATIHQYSLDLIAATEPANSPPVISGTASNSIEEGVFYMFTPTSNDADNDNLFFSVENLPVWAQFDITTGTILGVPMHKDVGLHENIVITVSDGSATSSLSGISINVTDAQFTGIESPLLSKIYAYSVYLGTSNDNLDTLIDIGTGSQVRAQNTFPSSDTYYYSIVARDADGNKILLSNTEIAGYRVYLGASSDALSAAYNLTEGTDRIYWINELLPGTYFLSFSTYDVNGNESALSNIVQFDLM